MLATVGNDIPPLETLLQVIGFGGGTIGGLIGFFWPSHGNTRRMLEQTALGAALGGFVGGIVAFVIGLVDAVAGGG